jgi:hypothetical protein
VQVLSHGGYVILMRHASSPRTPPATSEADPENTSLERQLGDTGRTAARGMGIALRELRIPITEVWSSPTYRALETARLAALPTPKTAPQLGDSGQSMQASGAEQSEWLRRKATAPRERHGHRDPVAKHRRSHRAGRRKPHRRRSADPPSRWQGPYRSRGPSSHERVAGAGGSRPRCAAIGILTRGRTIRMPLRLETSRWC